MTLMTRADIDLFEKLVAQLGSAHEELSALVKKSPNDAVNIFKLKLINSTLAACNQMLGQRYMPFQEFSTFGLDELPTNSDVSFILSQYLECAEQFRSDRIVQNYPHANWHWRQVEGEDRVSTAPPKMLTSKPR